MIEARPELTDIYTVTRGGAYGDFDSFGQWVYGKGADAKVRQCTARLWPDDTILVSAAWGKLGTRQYASSRFSRSEWQAIVKLSANRAEQLRVGNEILRKRRVARFLQSELLAGSSPSSESMNETA